MINFSKKSIIMVKDNDEIVSIDLFMSYQNLTSQTFNVETSHVQSLSILKSIVLILIFFIGRFFIPFPIGIIGSSFSVFVMCQTILIMSLHTQDLFIVQCTSMMLLLIFFIFSGHNCIVPYYWFLNAQPYKNFFASRWIMGLLWHLIASPALMSYFLIHDPIKRPLIYTVIQSIFIGGCLYGFWSILWFLTLLSLKNCIFLIFYMGVLYTLGIKLLPTLTFEEKTFSWTHITSKPKLFCFLLSLNMGILFIEVDFYLDIFFMFLSQIAMGILIAITSLFLRKTLYPENASKTS
jgi:hypothetical protein